MAAGTSEEAERESVTPVPRAAAVPFRSALVPAVTAWITARVVVLLALGFAHYVVDHIGRPKAASLHAVHDGLLAWAVVGVVFPQVLRNGSDTGPAGYAGFEPHACLPCGSKEDDRTCK